MSGYAICGVSEAGAAKVADKICERASGGNAKRSRSVIVYSASGSGSEAGAESEQGSVELDAYEMAEEADVDSGAGFAILRGGGDGGRPKLRAVGGA